MTPVPDITLYFARASRAFTPLWLLEELGLPYRLKTMNLKRGDQKTAGYRRINRMGKVPALTDGETVVAENPAICLYLADRYSYGDLAPEILDPPAAPPICAGWCSRPPCSSPRSITTNRRTRSRPVGAAGATGPR